MWFTVNERLDQGGYLYREVAMKHSRHNTAWSVYMESRRRMVSLFVVPLVVVE